MNTTTIRLDDYKGYAVYKETEKIDGLTNNYYWLYNTDREHDDLIDIFLSLEDLKEAVDGRQNMKKWLIYSVKNGNHLIIDSADTKKECMDLLSCQAVQVAENVWTNGAETVFYIKRKEV